MHKVMKTYIKDIKNRYYKVEIKKKQKQYSYNRAKYFFCFFS